MTFTEKSRWYCRACYRRRAREHRLLKKKRQRRNSWSRKVYEAILSCLTPDELRELRRDINHLLTHGYMVRLFQ